MTPASAWRKGCIVENPIDAGAVSGSRHSGMDEVMSNARSAAAARISFSARSGRFLELGQLSIVGRTGYTEAIGSPYASVDADLWVIPEGSWRHRVFRVWLMP